VRCKARRTHERIPDPRCGSEGGTGGTDPVSSRQRGGASNARRCDRILQRGAERTGGANGHAAVLSAVGRQADPGRCATPDRPDAPDAPVRRRRLLRRTRGPRLGPRHVRGDVPGWPASVRRIGRSRRCAAARIGLTANSADTQQHDPFAPPVRLGTSLEYAITSPAFDARRAASSSPVGTRQCLPRNRIGIGIRSWCAPSLQRTSCPSRYRLPP